MKRFSVEIGQVFGRLTVAGDGVYDGHSVMVPCSCSCGGTRAVARHRLVSGHTSSCGCIKKERLSKSRVIDLAGRRFSSLTAIEQCGRTKNKGVRWTCLCDCGGICITTGSKLLCGSKTHCGCQKKPRKRIADHPLHATWSGMIQRCKNINSASYANYGGRGVTVCDRWVLSFSDFLTDVGEKPTSMHTLDRIDNNGNYEPGNIRWATRTEQARNKSNNRILEFQGEAMCCSDWADRIGIDVDVLLDRLNKLKWTVERAITTPIRSAVFH